MVSKTRFLPPVLSLSVVSFLLMGCPPKQGTLEEGEFSEGMETPVETEAPPSDQAGQPGLEIGSTWAVSSQISTVYFGYMAAELTSEAREALRQNAILLKAALTSAPSVQIRVEGHCDERGTLEYNLALGQRRANAVRSYYVSLGIPKSALSTISYGEEHLACDERTEDCWSRCRRSETTLRSSAGPVTVPLESQP
jgi:peptidoglycan-associated lipoprotein